jgi:hypothetical protein
MNFQQIGYSQALQDLGFTKEAGVFSSIGKGITSLFRSRAPAAAAVTGAPVNSMAKTVTQSTRVPLAPTATQSQFIEGLKSRSVAPMAPFKTEAQRMPMATAAPRSKNMPGYDPATARLQAAPKVPTNLAQQNQFAGSFPERATQLRQSDQLLQARQQMPIVNSLFKSQTVRPRLQEAMGLFG